MMVVFSKSTLMVVTVKTPRLIWVRPWWSWQRFRACLALVWQLQCSFLELSGEIITISLVKFMLLSTIKHSDLIWENFNILQQTSNFLEEKCLGLKNRFGEIILLVFIQWKCKWNTKRKFSYELVKSPCLFFSWGLQEKSWKHTLAK